VWFKKYWKSILGVAFWLGPIWDFIKWCLDWRGRIDALAASYHDLGGYHVMIAYLLNPPSWLYPPFMIAGLALIWWNFRRNRKPVHIHHVEIREHMARASVSPVAVQWKNVPEAIEAFAESSLLKARDKWKAQLEEALVKAPDAEAQIRNIKKLHTGNMPDDTSETGALAAARERLVALGISHDLARDELKLAWDELRSDIHRKLSGGALIAKGFQVPHVAGSAEMEIPPAEWRILLLDNEKSEAVRKDDRERVYIGLMISKCPPA
jgi:hypothetical protein